MKPVDQTRFGIEEPLTEAPGNCFAAALASLLELELHEVPDEADTWKPGMSHRESWRLYEPRVFDWLREEQGFLLVEVQIGDLFFRGGEFDSYCILSGPSPRNNDVFHAVVGQGNKIVHDPHPSRDGLAQVKGKRWWYEMLIPLDPALYTKDKTT